MYSSRFRFLFAVLCILAFCTAVQATNLLITVQDNLDNTTVPHATVFLDGTNVGMTNNAGQYLLQSGQGSLNLLIRMDGYDDWTGIVSDNTTTLSVPLNRRSLVLNVSLFDSNTLSPVSGANLFLTSANSTQNAVSDSSGTASFAVTAYTFYALNITASNYQSRSETLSIQSSNQNIQYWLLSENQYSFVVKDQNTNAPIAGASISINAVPVGTTDSRGVLISPVSRNVPVTILIQKTGYQSENQALTISTNEAVDTITLNPVPVNSFVFVYDSQNQPISGATVAVNGTVVGTTNTYGQAALQDLVPGPYAVTVSKPGYTPVSEQMDFINETGQYPVVLSLATANQVIYVQDSDLKNIAGATVLLNGAVAGVTDAHGQMQTQLTFNTPYNITVTQTGYLPQTVNEEITIGNATAPLTITLQKNMDVGFVTLVGIGVLIVLFIYAVIRLAGRRNRHHVIKRNEI